ncbi:MAG: chemotaxis protein CheB [Planctomycetaceae bacterium]
MAVSGDEFYIVAIGSSAGGLVALESFFEPARRSSDVAYIIIQHLSPDFDSLMDQLLARRTEIPITVITDGMLVEAGNIYLLPPGKEAIITSGKLCLKDRSPARELTFPIDEFFRSLAQDYGPRAIGVILSGTGTDGSRGIQDMHAAGGLVISQDEETASFDGMPRSACGTGVVDLVLEPRKIPRAIEEYIRNPEVIKSRTRIEMPNSHSVDYMDASMRLILNLLNERYGLDFTHYRAPTIARRIERRLTLGGTALQEYAEKLKTDSDLLEELYFDLLIGVTSFFRDRQVFEQLELEVIPSLIEKLGPSEEFRAWVAGSATGEEAYSLAILLIEAFEAADRPCKVRIFASDVHERSLTRASQGIYPPDRVAGLLPHRLERFFEERPEGFRIVPEVRKLVVFTPHNVIHDAPFTRLDLVTCRNVLIYFNKPTQQKALSLLSFGLKSGGVLCLGSSETPGDLIDEFEAVDKTSRIFRKQRDTQLTPSSFRSLSNQSALSNAITRVQERKHTTEVSRTQSAALLGTYDRVLADFMPPSLLITRLRQLVHTFRGASKYLVRSDGRPSNDILDCIHKDLKAAVAAAVRRVCRENVAVSYRGVEVEVQDETESIRLEVKPYSDEEDVDHLLIQFAPETSGPVPVTQILSTPAANDEVEALDRELQITRDNLQASIQELQATNEQYQASNEELTAANEELQSTNEELHSVNEELYTVNAEHQRKIDELTEMTDDMDNLLTTTNVHTLFLDAELRLRRFTPRIAEFFNLIPQDIGRRIESFTNNLVDDDLVDEVRSVLETENSFEREVRDKNSCWYLLRIFPYLSRGNVEGAVLTLVDITSMKEASDALLRSEQRFDLAVRGSNEGIWDWQDISQEYIWCSRRFYSLLGYEDSELFEMTFSLWRDILHHEDHDRVVNAIEAHLADGTPFDVECRIECKDGQYRWFHCCGAAERTEGGTATRMAGSLDDITERRHAQDAVRLGVARRDQFLAMLSHELRNPLAAILNAVQLLDVDDAAANAAVVIQRQSRQMARLLEDLLDVSRITHGKLELVRRPTDIVKVVEQALEIVPSREEQGMQVSVELPEQPLVVDGDPTRLEQVVVNLVVNAFKYTPAGGDVAVSVVRDDDSVAVTVCDSGVGISQEMLGNIFGLFVQSDETIHRSNGGMGVGLTLVKSVIDLHGGSVEAHSDGLGRGSRFVVRLPLIKKPVESLEAPAPEPTEITNVVIVEDMDDAREMLQLLLQGQGYEVSSAGDGRSGLDLIRQARPDVAFVDIGLPGLDGYEVAKQLRSDSAYDSVRLVALTGYGRPSDRLAVADAGFDDHLVKPLKPEDLNRSLRPNRAKALTQD